MYLIFPGLYLGDARDAFDLPAMVNNNIRCIINATKTDVPFNPLLSKRISKIRIPVDDNGNRSHDVIMFVALPYAVHRIYIHISLGHKVLIHCYAGRQRSACIVAAYLIWAKGLTIDQAVDFVRSKKRDAFFPAVNFNRTLQMWEDKCKNKSTLAIDLPKRQKTYEVD